MSTYAVEEGHELVNVARGRKRSATTSTRRWRARTIDRLTRYGRPYRAAGVRSFAVARSLLVVTPVGFREMRWIGDARAAPTGFGSYPKRLASVLADGRVRMPVRGAPVNEAPRACVS